MNLLKKLFIGETKEAPKIERIAFYTMETTLPADPATIKLERSSQLQKYHSGPWVSLFIHASGANVLCRGYDKAPAEIVITGLESQTDKCYDYIKDILPINFPRTKTFRDQLVTSENQSIS